jgi:hypothetical protein
MLGVVLAATVLSAVGASAGVLQLSWQDNANNETSFKIERRIESGGSFSEIAVAGQNASSFLDIGLTAGTSYCYRLRASNGEGDSGYSNEACAPARTNIFEDVPEGYWAQAFVEALYNAGVTGGCSVSPLNYCPESPVTREQMAVFLLKALDGASFTPAGCTAAPFADVPCSSPFAPWIQALVTLGITTGCGGNNYCPGNPVTREQMAVFLLRTIGGPAYTPPPCATPHFADVPCSSPFAPWVEDLITRGITAGCSAASYCPTNPVNRAEMAVFLVKTFNIAPSAPSAVDPVQRRALHP